MASTTATIAIHLDFDLNGEPITAFLKVPAAIEDHEGKGGLTVHLHIDGRALAKAILPDLVREIRNTTQTKGH